MGTKPLSCSYGQDDFEDDFEDEDDCNVNDFVDDHDGDDHDFEDDFDNYILFFSVSIWLEF